MRGKIRIIFFINLFLVFLFLLNNSLMGNIDEEEVTKLIVGQTKIIPVSSPSRVIIASPDVADIANITNSEITLSAKAPGVTTLVFWDVFGEQSVKIKVISEDMGVIKDRIDNLLSKVNLPEVYTQAAEEEGKILLLGTVKTPQDREKIAVALGSLKEKTVDLVEVKEEETTVEIDVQVLELNKDATNTLGFTWPGTTGSITATDSSVPTTTAGTFSNLFTINRFTRSAFSLTWKLDLLIQEGKARVLSRPRLACQSGKEAQLLVGGEKPTFTTTTTEGGATSSTVEYKEYGIKLKIRPTVIEENRIKLAMNVEVSEVGAVETIGSATAPTGKAYPLTKRTASTELYLDNGETMAIGGLIKQKTEEDLRKFPWLADVPVLGLFFRQKITKVGGGQGERGNTELFITLTPTIIGEKKEAEQVEKKTEPKETHIALKRIPDDPVTGYTSVVQKRILENLVYPAIAKKAGFQGTVRLSMRLSYLGELLDVTVKESSGFKILDDNAISAAKGTSSYPPFPTSIQQKELWIELPIVYRLD